MNDDLTGVSAVGNKIDKDLVSRMVKDKSVQDRFMAKVMPEPNTGCWIWIASMNIKGYGTFGIGQRSMSSTSHRVSYEMFKGDIPKGMHVLHHCDNPFCVNPDHLWLGTNLDNNKDKVKKGRAAKGIFHPRARLNDNYVRIIREAYSMGFTKMSIAKYFKIGHTTVRSIIDGINWKHVI